MSFSLDTGEPFTKIEFYGAVDALDIVQIIDHPDFVPSLKRHQKVVFDFGNAETIRLEAPEMKRFALLANVEANFTESVIICIVLSTAMRRENAEYYKSEVTAPLWQVHIVESMQQALEVFSD